MKPLVMKLPFSENATPPQGFLSWGVYNFWLEIQQAADNYYQKGQWHMGQTLKLYGYDWSVLGNPTLLDDARAALTDHARQRRAEKAQEVAE